MALQRKELIVVHDILTNDPGRMRMWLSSSSPLCSRASTPRTASPWRPWFQQSTEVTFVAASLLSAAQHLGHLGSPALILTPVGLWQSKSRSFKVAGGKMSFKENHKNWKPKKTQPQNDPMVEPCWAAPESSGACPHHSILGSVFNRLCRKCFQTTGEDFHCQQKKYLRCSLSCSVDCGADNLRRSKAKHTINNVRFCRVNVH